MSHNNKLILRQTELLYNAKSQVEKEFYYAIHDSSVQLFFEILLYDKPVILRVSEYSYDKREHIDLETKWMSYLSSEINNVIKPIHSINKNFYEIIECDNKKYIICVFEKAIGEEVDRKDSEYNETLFYKLGIIMGHMHSITKKYNDYNSNVIDKFAWHNNWATLSKYNINIEEEIKLIERGYIELLNLLPKTKDTYGIIHGDLHPSNYFIDNGHISIFDFDDCEFNWYVNEIAMILYQELQSSGTSNDNKKDRTKFAETFLLSYLKGYFHKNPINKDWILLIDLFLKYRRITIYKLIKSSGWDNDYIAWLKSGIINDTPFVEINYQKIIDEIYE